MDDELKKYLEDMKGELKTHVTAACQGVEDRTAAMIAGEVATLHNELKASEERIGARIEQSQTHLLGEFWKWARTADARYRQHHGAVLGLDERVQLVEDRISEIERKAS
jgi:hypothetical protein